MCRFGLRIKGSKSYAISSRKTNTKDIKLLWSGSFYNEETSPWRIDESMTRRIHDDTNPITEWRKTNKPNPNFTQIWFDSICQKHYIRLKSKWSPDTTDQLTLDEFPFFFFYQRSLGGDGLVQVLLQETRWIFLSLRNGVKGQKKKVNSLGLNQGIKN
jgi:hypothetical protein